MVAENQEKSFISAVYRIVEQTLFNLEIKVSKRKEKMEITKCPTCGTELTADMKLAHMCFFCGNELPLTPEEIKIKLEQEQIERAQMIEKIKAEEAKRRLEEAESKAKEEKRKAEEAEYEKWQQEQLQENNRILSVGKQHLMKSRQNIKYRYLEINDIYEYDVVSIWDEDNGAVDINRIKSCVNLRALEGWRLVNVTTNRIGTNSSSSGYAGISHGTNAAIDQTILFFERCVQRYNYDHLDSNNHNLSQE